MTKILTEKEFTEKFKEVFRFNDELSKFDIDYKKNIILYHYREYLNAGKVFLGSVETITGKQEIIQ